MHDVRCRNYDQIGTRPKRTHSRTLLLRTFARVPLIGMASDCLRKGLYLVAVSVEFEKENLLDHGRQILVQGRWKRNQGRRDPRILLPSGPLIFGDVKTLEIFAFRGWDSTKKKQLCTMHAASRSGCTYNNFKRETLTCRGPQTAFASCSTTSPLA